MFEKFESSKTLSKKYIRIYTKILDLISEAYEISTIKQLIDEQDYLVSEIEKEFDGKDDATKQKKRIWYSAIFWALNLEPLKNKKAYYDAFQKAKQNYKED